MFENNPLLRAEREAVTYTEEQLLELLKCQEDILYFAEKFCYIQTNDDGFILPKLREYQKKILKAYTDKKSRKSRKNCILMAPRQSAKTVTSSIFIVHYLIFNKEKNVGIVANKQETAIEIVDKIREIYERLPLWMQPGIVDGGWNKKGLRLANGMRLLSSASTGGGLRGYTLSLLYMDEFAFVQKNVAEKFMRAMFPTVATGKESMIIITSTPQGMNHFSDLWQAATREIDPSDFYPIRVFESEVPRALPHEEFKKKIIDTNGQIYWLQEFECVSGTTIVTVRDKVNNEVRALDLNTLVGELRAYSG